MLVKRIEDINSLKVAINRYTDDTELQGDAYTSSKEHMRSNYIPMFTGLVNACYELRNANNALKGHLEILYDNEIDMAATHEDLSRQRINLQNYETRMYEESHRKPLCHFTLASYRYTIAMTKDRITRCEEIIRSVRDFERKIANVYDTAETMFSRVEAAQSLLERVTCNSDGTYTFPPRRFCAIAQLKEMNQRVIETAMNGYSEVKTRFGSQLKTNDLFQEALLGVGISLSAIITGLTRAVSPFVDENYEYNSRFAFNGTIYSQKMAEAQLRMGYREGSYNGCAWIATYNAALLLGERYHPADIIKYYETSGGALINGELGINPLAIGIFFDNQGFETTMDTLPKSVDEQIRNSTVSILTYAHPTAVNTVAVYYENGSYHVINEGRANSTNTAPGVLDSVDEWLEGREGFWPISVISLDERS